MAGRMDTGSPCAGVGGRGDLVVEGWNASKATVAARLRSPRVWVERPGLHGERKDVTVEAGRVPVGRAAWTTTLGSHRALGTAGRGARRCSTGSWEGKEQD